MILKVKINRSIGDVFIFVLNPENTPRWVKNIVAEKVNEWPVKVGSIYKSQNEDGRWSELEVTRLEKNKSFFFV